MGLEEVVAEIDGKAKSDAEAILKEAKAASAEILNKAEKEIEEKKSLAGQDLNNVKAASEKRELAAAELACKKMVQDAKKEMIGAAYDGMKMKLSALGASERAKALGQLFEKCRAEIGDIGTIYVSGKDSGLAASLFSLKNISVKERQISGGLVAESADGTVSADYSFDSIIESVRERAIKDVSRILFE